MRRLLVFCLASVLLLAMSFGAEALSTPDITFIPPMISLNSSFVAIADAGTGASTRITWTVPGVENAYGLFPNTDSGFVCYFSDADEKSTCGPVPFPFYTIGLTPFDMIVNAVDSNGAKTNLTEKVDVGTITVSPILQVTGDTVYMVVSTRGGVPPTLYYSVHKTDLTSVEADQTLTYSAETDRFTANTQLEQGEYYISFWGAMTGNTDWGSALTRITVGEGATGPGLMQADEVDVHWPLSSGQAYEQTGFKLNNVGGAPISNITVNVPAALQNYIEIELTKESLGVNETTFFTVKFSGSTSGLSLKGEAEIVSSGTAVGTIPFSVLVSIIEGEGQVCEVTAGGLSVSPTTWSATGVAGDSLTKTVTITNKDDSAISDLTYSAGGSLSSITTVSLPSTIAADGTGLATITVSPVTSSVYVGAITFSSSAGSASMAVGLEIQGDLSIEIEDVKDDLRAAEASLTSAQLSEMAVVDLIDDIKSRIDDAESDFESGSYELAQRELEGAKGRIAALSSVAAASAVAPTTGAPAGGNSMLIPIILIVVLIAAAGGAAWYYFTKMKKKPQLEKELEEEY